MRQECILETCALWVSLCNVLTLYIILFRSSLRIKHEASVFSKHYTGDEEIIESTTAHQGTITATRENGDLQRCPIPTISGAG